YHEERDLRTRPVENTEELALRSDLIVEPFAFGAEQPIRIAGKPIPEPAAIEVPVVIGPDADSALPPSFFFLSALEPTESFLGLQSVLAKLLFHGTTEKLLGVLVQHVHDQQRGRPVVALEPVDEPLSAAAVQRLARLPHELLALNVALLEATFRQARADDDGTDERQGHRESEREQDLPIEIHESISRSRHCKVATTRGETVANFTIRDSPLRKIQARAPARGRDCV